jgi:hypothetical protein
MKTIYILAVCALFASCSLNLHPDDENNLTSKFNGTWNIHEGIERNINGVITYNALPWGGLVASVKERNMPVDWSGYESITFEFEEPTKVPTQIMVSDKLKTVGKAGITSLTCYFDGQDLTSVDEVALQSSDTSTILVKNVFLTPGRSTWESTPIWEGNCALGNWENGFVVKPEQFISAIEGDKIEILFNTDTSDPNRGYWLLKTVYNETDKTLEGNENELNEWGCAMMGRSSTVYRILLTANDIKNLRKNGLFVNGYYTIVSQVNLLRRGLAPAASEQ